MPDKIVSYRNKKGILKKINPSEGGTVAASKAELIINGQTYQINDVIGASINARIKTKNILDKHAERTKISRAYIARRKNNNKAVNNDLTTGHAEQDNLGILDIEIQKTLGSKKINVAKKDIKGQVYMHVDRKVCEQCTANVFKKKNDTKGPLYLFSVEYPNIEIIITNNELPGLILKIKDGNIIK